MGNLRYESTQIVYGRITLVATLTVFIAALLSLAALPERPQRPLPPNVAAIQLQFSNIEDGDAHLWAEVEWLAGDGAWVVTDGWRGTPDIAQATARNDAFVLDGEHELINLSFRVSSESDKQRVQVTANGQSRNFRAPGKG